MSSALVSSWRRFAGGAIGVALIAAGLAKMWSVARGGVDFPSMYVMGEGVTLGRNIYDPAVALTFPGRFGVVQPAGMFYPPATGVIMAPFALLPFGVSKTLWFVLLSVSMIFGVRALVQRVAPGRPSYVWTISAGIVLLSSAVRWGMMLLQGAPLVLGLLCLFVALLHGERPRLTLIVAALATALKMTLALPFLGLLALHRRFGALAASLGAWLLLDVVGFLRMGRDSFAMYRENMGSLEALNTVNAPDPWSNPALPRLDWTFLVYGITGQLTVARLATFALSGGVALWLLFAGYRARQRPSLATSTAFLAALVCLGSLAVYHHEYDACLFLTPLLLGFFLWQKKRPPTWTLLVLAPLTLMLLLLPLGVVRGIMTDHFGTLGVGLTKLSFPVAFSLAICGSLGIIHWNARAEASAPKAELGA